MRLLMCFSVGSPAAPKARVYPCWPAICPTVDRWVTSRSGQGCQLHGGTRISYARPFDGSSAIGPAQGAWVGSKQPLQIGSGFSRLGNQGTAGLLIVAIASGDHDNWAIIQVQLLFEFCPVHVQKRGFPLWRVPDAELDDGLCR